MPLSVIRFDLRAKDLTPAENAAQYATALDMAAFADEKGFDMLVLSEHHAAPDGYLPSPLALAGAVLGRTKRIPVNIAALLIPLHDPIRLAEDIAVLDLLSSGRLSIVTGLGYRPEEYALLGKEWKRRGKLLDEALDTMVKAWTGEPFEYRGETVQVLPKPFSQPHPMVFVGGSGKKSAERAARLGLSYFPAVGDQGLAEHYVAECERLGITPGMVALPEGPGSVFIAEDPDKAWKEIGDHLLYDAMTYHEWQSDDIRSHVHSYASTVDELRAEGTYQILSPAQAIEVGKTLGWMGPLTHHPLCGGTPAEQGWRSLELFVEKVMPELGLGTAATA